eukprot:3088072-Alexandrium_andersonii.AAC.1
MSASLVGSEMCIRDRFRKDVSGLRCGLHFLDDHASVLSLLMQPLRRPVSYTHLTLPTICSV